MPDPLPQAATDLMTFLEEPTRMIVARLGVNPIPDLEGPLQLSDMVEASFPGYAGIVKPPWNLVDNAEEFYAEAFTEILNWTAGAIVTPQEVTCVYVTVQDGADPVRLLWVFPLPEPIVFDTLDQVYQKIVRVASTDLSTVSP